MAVAAKSLKDQVDALNKTVKVLKKSLYNIYNYNDESIISQQLNQARRRQEAYQRKQELAELKNQQLQQYNEKLEEEVKKRTHTIKTIVDNVKSGFFLADNEFKIKAGCTKSCFDLFGHKTLENRCFLDLLDLSDKHRQHYLSLAEEIFEDTLGPGSEDLYLVQLPTRFKTIDGRWLNIEASIVRDENEHLDSILYTVNDVSDLMKVHEQNNRNWAMLNIIKQKDAFLSFLEDTRTQIQICYEALQNEEEKILRRHLHTIKGNTAAYEIVHIVNYIHDLEDKEVIRHDDIWEIENLFRTFLRENYDILEIPYDANESSSLEVHRNHLDELMSIVSQLPGTEAKTIHNWIHKVSRRPTRIYLGPINQFVHKLSERLNKDFEFCVTGDDVLVPENTKALFHSVSHLIRNAIDHGVEKPGERTKPGRCSVQLKIQDTDKGVYIEVTDDGRGIDTAKISQKALDLGLIDQKRFDNMSYDDKCRLILLDSLSAADTVTEISGRGVGMSAVVSEVEDLGGELQIHSRENEGASFKILIPRKAK